MRLASLLLTAAAALAQVKMPRLAPDFLIVELFGRTAKLSSFRGQVVPLAPRADVTAYAQRLAITVTEARRSMIDSSLHAPLLHLLLFHLRQLFWLYVWPVMVGFVTIFCFKIYLRVGLMGARSKLLVFALSAAASALSLFGWATIVRSMRLIPLYACGVGLANLLASQIYALTLPRHPRLRIRLPKVVWRGDQDTVRKFQERLAAASGAPGRAREQAG